MANHPNRTKARSIFETETCSRCGGSGEYSYCEMYGRTCFKCGGSGRMYTKRGLAARAWLLAQRKALAKDVQVGQTVAPTGIKPFVVTRVGFGGGQYRTEGGEWQDYWTIEGEGQSYGTFPDHEIVIVPPKAIAQQQLADAVAYQNTLTKNGAPRKRAA